ncbi:MAG: hypothetical protein U9R19_07575 [Bacteroidota bacterium]|nr:hypothetical protein [Bacteroidota bacterium]
MPEITFMEIKMFKRLILIVFAMMFLLASYYLINSYKNFRTYKSNEFVTELSHWWPVLDKFYVEKLVIPNTNSFFDYCKNDTSVINEFPGIVPVELKINDIIITSDTLLTIDVWLFSLPKNNMDTIYYNDMSYFDFLLKRSILISSTPLLEPCGTHSIILLKNNKRIKLSRIIKNRFLHLFYSYGKNPNIDRNSGHRDCCVHAYFKNKQMVMDVLTVNSTCEKIDTLTPYVVDILQSIEYNIYDYKLYFKLQ